jgi:hypothetical protein
MYKTYPQHFVKASTLFVLVFAFLANSLSVRAQCGVYDPALPYVCGPPSNTNCAPYPKNQIVMENSQSLDITYDNMTEYMSGQTFSGSTVLHLKVDSGNAACKWKLVMYIDNGGAPTAAANWQSLGTYGGSGAKPNISLLQVRVYNSCNTPMCESWENFTTTSQAIDIIKDPLLIPAGSCATNVNGLGSYLNHYNEYTFTIDYRIVPGFVNQPGTYMLTLKFCLVEDD